MWKVTVILAVCAVGYTTQQIPLVNNQNHCEEECGRFFSPHTNRFEQVSDSWGACAHGCHFFNRLESRGRDEPIQILKNCNDSCDERYQGSDSQACMSGCGFNYEMATTEIPASPRILETATPSQQPSFISLSLPSLFQQINKAMPKLNQIMERTFSNPFNSETDFNMPALPSFSSFPSIPRLSEGILGRKDTEHVEPMFDDFLGLINNQMNNMLKSMPKMENLNAWSPFPFAGPKSGGKITVINAGPGYVEEKHYNIGPDGNIVEVVKDQPKEMLMDAIEHENPLDTNMNESDVEVFKVPKEAALAPLQKIDPLENEIESEQADVVQIKDTDRSSEESNEVDSGELAEPRVEVRRPEFEIKMENIDPFLSVLRNSMEDGDRMEKEFFKKLRSWRESQYADNNSCSSSHLRWSDWVSCVHVQLGVPRWLTAATIALGIVFTVWLCLIIPTSAPKQRIRPLLIKTEKLSLPSAVVSKEMTAAEAKEAEAKAANETVIAVIKVDLPPSYNDVTPGSPAPSYKSDMVPPVPGSPAPSYKSVDLPPTKEEEKTIEPVHGKESVA